MKSNWHILFIKSIPRDELTYNLDTGELMGNLATILGLMIIHSTVFASDASDMRQSIEQSPKVKSVLSAMKQQEVCETLNYTETKENWSNQFTIIYNCNNGMNSEDQQLITISGHAFSSGSKVEVSISKASAEDAPVVGE